MSRPSATAVLLLAAALARATAIALSAPDGAFEPLLLVSALDVLVPTGIAAADLRRRSGAASAAMAYGALGAAILLANGLAALEGSVPVTGPRVALLAGAALGMLAGATAIGRWQDHGAPQPGAGPRWLRIVAVAAAVALAGVLVTEDVAVIGPVEVPGGVLPGPVGIATAVSLQRLPLVLGVLLPMAWAATRAGTQQVRAVALVLGARAVVEAVADATLVGLGAPVWPALAGGIAAVLLLLVVPLGAQLISSRA